MSALVGGRDGLCIELGAGSGQATLDLAARFKRVVAVEPDAKLARAGSRTVAVRFTVCEPMPTAPRPLVPAPSDVKFSACEPEAAPAEPLASVTLSAVLVPPAESRLHDPEPPAWPVEEPNAAPRFSE